MSLLVSPLGGNEPNAGERVSASWLRKLWSIGAENRIRSIVGGTIKRNPDGVDLVIAQTSYPGRAYAAYGAASTSVTTGATCSLTALVQDHDETKATNMEICTLASNQITFTKPGQYLVTYHASFELDIGGATTHVPAVTNVTSYLRADGNTLAGTTHYASAAQVLNLSDFVKTDGGEPSFEIYEDTIIDNLESIADYTPAFSVRATTSGTTLVKVVLNSSGELKIRVPGPTDYAPILDIYATGADSRSVTNVSTSLSITRLA